MGTDFIEKATPGFLKLWDRARVTLATADLFTRTPDTACRTVAADLLGDARLELGDRLTVEVVGDTLIARRGHRDVARVGNPPSELLTAVRESCGIATGTVERVHDLAGVAEIALC